MIARSFSMTSLAAAAMLAGGAQAATTPLNATQMLQQFNLVVSGNLNSTSHVQGRTYVGGDANAVDFVQQPLLTPASDYAGVTVRGNMLNSSDAHIEALGLVVGGSASKVIVNGGDAYIGGNASGSSFQGNAWVTGTANQVNFNGDGGYAGALVNTNNNRPLSATTASMNTAVAASTSTDFGAVMTGLSRQLSTLHGSSSANVDFNSINTKATFSGSGVNGVLVFDLTKDDLDSKIFASNITDLAFNFTNATTVIFNTNDKNLRLNANFDNAATNGSKFIWNFAGADSVTVGSTFGGQVLVADGVFSNVGGANVEGGVFAKTVNEYGQIHVQTFNGAIPAAVPEPETYAMLMAGLGLVGFIARRRKQAAAR